MPLHTFQAIEEAQHYNKRHGLLSNGFSIACRPEIFTYGRLYEQADFSTVSPTAKQTFDALGTQDFERVIKALRDSAQVFTAYVWPAALKCNQATREGNQGHPLICFEHASASVQCWAIQLRIP